MPGTAEDDWRGLALHGTDGAWIGQLAELYDDDGDAAAAVPVLAAVRTGKLGLRSALVPLRGMATREGDRVTVPFGKDQVTSAPTPQGIDSVEPDLVAAVWRHYYSPAAHDQAPAAPARLVRRRITVTVLPPDAAAEDLAAVLPPEVSAQDVQELMEADRPAVVVVHESRVEVAPPDDPR